MQIKNETTFLCFLISLASFGMRQIKMKQLILMRYTEAISM
jgi:hypothetical protein